MYEIHASADTEYTLFTIYFVKDNLQKKLQSYSSDKAFGKSAFTIVVSAPLTRLYNVQTYFLCSSSILSSIF